MVAAQLYHSIRLHHHAHARHRRHARSPPHCPIVRRAPSDQTKSHPCLDGARKFFLPTLASSRKQFRKSPKLYCGAALSAVRARHPFLATAWFLKIAAKNTWRTFAPNPGTKSSRLPSRSPSRSPSAGQWTNLRLSNFRILTFPENFSCRNLAHSAKSGHSLITLMMAIVAKIAPRTMDKFGCVILSINCAVSPRSHFSTNFPADWAIAWSHQRKRGTARGRMLGQHRANWCVGGLL